MRKNTLFERCLVITGLAGFLTIVSADQWKPAASLEKQPSGGSEMIMAQSSKTTNNKIVVRYSIPKAQFKPFDEKSEKMILGNAAFNAAEGEPLLPVIPSQIIIPAGQTIDKISITGLDRIDVPGSHHIEHHQGYYPLIPGVKPRIIAEKAEIYNSDNPFPGKTHDVVTVQKKHGVNIAVLKIYPATYYPRSGRLQYYRSLEVTITTKSSPSALSNENYHPERFDTATSNVENPSELSTYPARSQSSSAVPLGICNSSDHYQYVIVTSASILSDTASDYTVRDLIAKRLSQGLTATIVTIEDIYSNYTGIDNAEKLRNFTKDAYNTWGTEYVLLGGDINIIPMRKLYCVTYYTDSLPSDMYFQCLDGNFNSNGNGLWGESTDGANGSDIDFMAEVKIGRASVEDSAEMSNFVYKTLYYENSAAAESYLSTALMAGEHLGFGGVSEYATGSMEAIRLGSSSAGYTTAGFAACSQFAVDTLYDNTSSEWSASTLIQMINSNTYGIINHLGHANYDNVMKLNNSDADALTNTKPLFVYSQGCIPGNFEVDCIAEHFTTSTRHGMYGAVLNSHYGWGSSGSSNDGPSEYIDRQFWDAYFGESIMTLGGMNADSHEDNIWTLDNFIRWCIYETNLFGDPATMMRGKVNGPLVSYNSSTVNDSIGNANGTINPGEALNLSVSLVNTGSDSARSVHATLSTSDSYTTISQSEADYGTITCCMSSKWSQQSYIVVVSPSCPTPHTIPLTLHITDAAGHEWNSNFTLPVYTSSQIRGVVMTKTGSTPIAGATVSYSGPLSGSVTTNNQGCYSINVINGTYTLRAISSAYLSSASIQVTTPPDTAVNFNLSRPIAQVQPSQINESVVTGSSKTVNLRLANTGDTTLQFSVAVSDQVSTATASTYVYPSSHFVTLGKGETDTRVGLPVNLNQGGQDSFGYRWKDSRETSGPSFVWNDISTTGSLLNSVSSCDDCYETVGLSFSFPFYGTNYSSIYVSSNGYITVGLAGTSYANYPLPSTSAPKGLIAALWGDLNTNTSGDVYLKDYGDRFVVQYNNVAPYSGSGLYTFQIEVSSSGVIKYYYKSMTGSVLNTTVGIQNQTGNVGLQIVYNSSYIVDSLAVEIRSTPGWLQVTPTSGSVSPASESNLQVKFDAKGLEVGTYTGTILISHNDPTKTSPITIPVTLQVRSSGEPPVITVNPADLTKMEGQTASFTVEATGTDLNYQWQRNGIAIQGATNSTCTISSVSLADNGAQFRCVVSNSLDTVTSTAATLTVTVAPPVINRQPVSVIVKEKEQAVFSISASGSNLEYQWQKNRADIAGATTNVYTIPHVVLADSGAYFRCIVKNSGGSVTSDSADLIVLHRLLELQGVSIGESAAAAIKGNKFTAESVIIGSPTSGTALGRHYILYLK